QAGERPADEPGVDPGPALRALEADVLAQAPHLDTVADAAGTGAVPAPAPATAPAGVGRDAELARLRQVAAAAEQTGLRVVWVGGEPGAGKTTLLRMFAAELRDRGWRVAWGRCPEVDGAPPAWAWSEILRELADLPDQPGGEALAPLLAGEASAGSQFRLAQAVGARLGDAGPLLVVLDDIHRADGETLQVLRHLAAALAERPLLVVPTHRPGEAQPQLDGARAALAGPRSTDLDLGGLDADAAAALLHAHLGAALDPEAAVLVHPRTGGNPLFLIET
ncbi:ATP-binding protein, partial [Dactylosporangium fulvum]|uniref:ATP-binding protein n=1 Tax=Dactylosporangium fulvum TaxID=53359 RepID=UPI0031CEAAC9